MDLRPLCNIIIFNAVDDGRFEKKIVWKITNLFQNLIVSEKKFKQHISVQKYSPNFGYDIVLIHTPLSHMFEKRSCLIG